MIEEVIKLLVKPNASKNSIDGLLNGRLKVRISSPPEKGRANRELINFISKKTDIPKKYISIISGEKSSFKEIAVLKKTEKSFLEVLLNS